MSYHFTDDVNAAFKNGRRAGHEDVANEILLCSDIQDAWLVASDFLSQYETTKKGPL